MGNSETPMQGNVCMATGAASGIGEDSAGATRRSRDPRGPQCRKGRADQRLPGNLTGGRGRNGKVLSSVKRLRRPRPPMTQRRPAACGRRARPIRTF